MWRNFCVTSSGWTAGTTTTVTITNNTTYCINGRAYVKAAASNVASPTIDYNTGTAFRPVLPNTGSVFVAALDSGGAIRVMQGEITDLDASGNFITYPEFPSVPDNVTPIGYTVIKAGSTASASGWIFGTHNMSGVTGITYSFVSCLVLPSRPVAA